MVIRIRRPGLAVLSLFLLIGFVNIVQQIGYRAVVSVVAAVSSREIPIYSVEVPDKRLAVSLDATWGATRTRALLDVLDKHSVKTTFFLAGYWIEEYPDLVKEMAARGHEIGNHTYSHPHLNSLTRESIKSELERCSSMIEGLTGKRPTLFRPPFGEYSNKVIEVAKECGMETVQWDVDSLDWQNLTSTAIVQRVLNRTKPGSIVLFHNDGENTVQALDTILTRLASSGYRVVPISELILPGDTYVDHAGRQRLRPSSKNPVALGVPELALRGCER